MQKQIVANGAVVLKEGEIHVIELAATNVQITAGGSYLHPGSLFSVGVPVNEPVGRVSCVSAGTETEQFPGGLELECVVVSSGARGEIVAVTYTVRTASV